MELNELGLQIVVGFFFGSGVLVWALVVFVCVVHHTGKRLDKRGRK